MTTLTERPAGRPTEPPAPDRARRRRRPGPSAGWKVLVVGLLTAFALYFLLPVYWLVIAATKSTGDLFGTFGLWFSHFNFADNVVRFRPSISAAALLFPFVSRKASAKSWRSISPTVWS